MATIDIKDILISARLEATRMRHYYLGIEHLFIAMLEVRGGLTSTLIFEAGFNPEYVIESIRRKVGKGSRHRLWAGIPTTPRADVVLGIADELMKESELPHITERELLIAILDEGDNVPLRVLSGLGVDVKSLPQQAKTRQITRAVTQPFVSIDLAPQFGEELNKDELFILRRMFHGYAQVRVETRLRGGYSDSTLIVITPIQGDNREDAPVVVKIGPHDAIYDEAQRYERHVKGTLPPLTARLEDTVIAPQISDLAALKYTLITDDNGRALDVRGIVGVWENSKLANWLYEKLYNSFGTNWWMQSRPYRFETWQEYDWLLPPILTLELAKNEDATEDAIVLRLPIKRARLNHIEYGETVVVENFVVHRVDREQKSITLALGQSGGSITRPYQIKIRGINFEEDTYFRGEVVDKLAGRVWKTRNEELENAVRALEPDFDHKQNAVRFGDFYAPNPIMAYTTLLDTPVFGSLSTIHGDLHMGNILIGANDTALLIDFGHTREGHTLMDWATLEVSLLSELVLPHLEDGWASVRQLIPYLIALNESRIYSESSPISQKLIPILRLRQIVAERLAKPNHWEEYFIGLALLALRGVTWETLSVNQRRLMFLVSALAMFAIAKKQSPTDDHNTPFDDTEFSKNTGL